MTSVEARQFRCLVAGTPHEWRCEKCGHRAGQEAVELCGGPVFCCILKDGNQYKQHLTSCDREKGKCWSHAPRGTWISESW